eukprot:316168_1
MSSTSTLNLTESKQIEKSIANLKLSSIHSGGFAHILSNIECCGSGISSQILTLFHNVLQFLFNQSQKCANHQLGFTTPLLHLIGTLIRSQDLEWIASSNIVPYLLDFFSFSSLNSDNSTNVSFQQRFAAWTAFRTLVYSTSFPMFSSLPTISVNSIHKQSASNNSVSNTSPSSKCVALFAEKTETARIQVFNSVASVIAAELKTLYHIQKNHKINQFKDEDLKQILFKLHQRSSSYTSAEDEYNKLSGHYSNKPWHRKGKWSCDVCTFSNKKSEDTCTMCFRGVRPTYAHDDNECHDIRLYTLCLKCGAPIPPHKASAQCMQCGTTHDNLQTPLTYVYNEKLQILKWIHRLRQQSICNADMQFLYLLQQDISWLPDGTNSTAPNGSSQVHGLASSLGMNQLLWLLLRCCP